MILWNGMWESDERHYPVSRTAVTVLDLVVCYRHMPIARCIIAVGGQFVACFFVCVCTVSDFSAEDKASGVKFCTLVHWRPGQGMSYFGELYSRRSSKSDE